MITRDYIGPKTAGDVDALVSCNQSAKTILISFMMKAKFWAIGLLTSIPLNLRERNSSVTAPSIKLQIVIRFSTFGLVRMAKR
jgi:hypothetical protein